MLNNSCLDVEYHNINVIINLKVHVLCIWLLETRFCLRFTWLLVLTVWCDLFIATFQQNLYFSYFSMSCRSILFWGEPFLPQTCGNLTGNFMTLRCVEYTLSQTGIEHNNKTPDCTCWRKILIIVNVLVHPYQPFMYEAQQTP